MSPRPAPGAPRPLSPLRAVALFVIVSIAAPHAQTLQGTIARNNEPADAGATETRGSTVQLLLKQRASQEEYRAPAACSCSWAALRSFRWDSRSRVSR